MLGLSTTRPYAPSTAMLRAIAMRQQGWPQHVIRERCQLGRNSVHRRTTPAAARILGWVEPEVLEAIRAASAAGVPVIEVARRSHLGVSTVRLATEPWPEPVPTGWTPREWRALVELEMAADDALAPDHRP